MRFDFEKAIEQSKQGPLFNQSSQLGIINQTIELKKISRLDLKTESDINQSLGSSKDHYFKPCAYAILENKEKMLKELTNTIKEDHYDKIQAINDQGFELYRNNEDFMKLLKNNFVGKNSKISRGI